MSKINSTGVIPPIVCVSCKLSTKPTVKVTINISEIVATPDQNNAYQAIKDKIEPVFLTELLKYTDNNKQHASRIAGLNVTTINRKLKQHGLVITKSVRSGGGE